MLLNIWKMFVFGKVTIIFWTDGFLSATTVNNSFVNQLEELCFVSHVMRFDRMRQLYAPFAYKYHYSIILLCPLSPPHLLLTLTLMHASLEGQVGPSRGACLPRGHLVRPAKCAMNTIKHGPPTIIDFFFNARDVRFKLLNGMYDVQFVGHMACRIP